MQKQQYDDNRIIYCCCCFVVVVVVMAVVTTVRFDLNVFTECQAFYPNWYAHTHRSNFAWKTPSTKSSYKCFLHFESNLIRFECRLCFMYETWTRYCKHALTYTNHGIMKLNTRTNVFVSPLIMQLKQFQKLFSYFLTALASAFRFQPKNSPCPCLSSLQTIT